MIDQEVDEFLEHFGVKGMKWGVRKARKVQRGARKTVKFAARHPQVVGATLAGAAFAARLLTEKGGSKPLRRTGKVDLTTPFMAKYGNSPATIWSGPFEMPAGARPMPQGAFSMPAVRR